MRYFKDPFLVSESELCSLHPGHPGFSCFLEDIWVLREVLVSHPPIHPEAMVEAVGRETGQAAVKRAVLHPRPRAIVSLPSKSGGTEPVSAFAHSQRTGGDHPVKGVGKRWGWAEGGTGSGRQPEC